MDVSQAPDLASFKRNMVSMSANLGFPLVNCVLTHFGTGPNDPLAVYSVGNTPAAYAASSSDMALTYRDPVMTRLREQKLQPVAYDQAFYVSAGAADLWEEQAAFGYRHGIAASLYLPGNWRFAFGVDRDKPLPDGAELVSLQANMLLLMVHAQAAASRLLPNESVLAPRQTAKRSALLSNRELECLKWTRESKTAWEIGTILGISERTAVAHLSNAMKKLGCISKHQAVLKAIDHKLLS